MSEDPIILGNIAFEDASGADGVPEPTNIEQWVKHVLSNQLDTTDFPEVNFQVVDEASISELNETYRHKSGPTNVLSFPFEAPPGLPKEEADALLGDIVICAQVVSREAEEQSKTLQAHWAHMVVHGVLHLLGYDHLDDDEAEAMENLEVQLLNELTFPNPYQQA
jgi:probable rRNA maturation factor